MTTGSANYEWGVARWLATVLGLAATMAWSVVGLTRWPVFSPTEAVPHPDYRFELAPPGGRSSEAVLPDPTGFALGDAQGFSGAAARQLPRNAYTLAEFKSAPAWLKLDLEGQRLGEPARLAAVQARPDRLPVPTLPLSLQPAPLVPASNRVVADDAFAKRPILRITTGMPSFGEVLQATVVELGVNPWGQVVAARVVNASGSLAADKSALEASRGALFAPLPGRLKSAEAVLTELHWGRLTFNWGGGVPLR